MSPGGKSVLGQQITPLIGDRPGSRPSIAHMLVARTYNWNVTISALPERTGDIAPDLAPWRVHPQRSDAPNVAAQIDGPRMRFGDIPLVVSGMSVPKRLVMHYLQEGSWQIEAQGPVLSRSRDRRSTAREQDITGCPRKHRSNQAIAVDLGIFESMAKIHIRIAMKKLKAANRTQEVCCTQLNKPPRAVLAGQPMPSGVTFQPSCDQTGTATGVSRYPTLPFVVAGG
jgi:DNA-binding CsgD family transcriptional regulator